MSKSNFNRAIISGSAVLAILSLAISATARPPYVGVVKEVFPKAEINCKTCHPAKPPAVNKYGTAIKGVLNKAKDKKVLTKDEVLALCKKGVKPEGVK